MVQIENCTTYESKSNKMSLLKKYDIPVEHLEFAYIDNCTNGKELEHILQILRSGEEGHYPHLLERAESRLKKIKPHSKLLRTEEPVLTKKTLNTDDWNDVSKEIQEWSSEIQMVDSNLKKYIKKVKSDIPAVRKSETNEMIKNVKTDTNKTRIASCDYEGWEKYDPDVVLLKEEIEEEQYKNEMKKLKQQATKKKKSVAFNLNHSLSNEEALILANKEKECGNEYYRIEEYEEAERFYTKSILIKPTTNAYNNRCATNLKLKKYKEALQDSNSVLKIEPNNIKALARKSQALQALGEFSNALTTLERLISLEPQNDFAQKLIDEIEKELPMKKEKTVRLRIEDCSGNGEQNISLLNTKSNKIDLKQKFENISYNNRICTESNHGKLHSINYSNNEILGNKNNSKNKDQKTKKVIIPIPSTSSYCGPSIKIVEVPISSDSNNESDKQIADNNDIVKSEKKIIEIESTLSENRNELPRECVSNSFEKKFKKRIYTTSTEVNVLENTSVSDPKSCGEPFPENVNNNSINAPFEFIKYWKAIRNVEDISGYAQILRRVSPLNLSSVIGNKLDSEMLSILLKCLEYHFLIPTDVYLVLLFITNICYLPRFNIVAMFLEESDKISIRNILSFLQQHGEKVPEDIFEIIRKYI